MRRVKRRVITCHGGVRGEERGDQARDQLPGAGESRERDMMTVVQAVCSLEQNATGGVHKIIHLRPQTIALHAGHGGSEAYDTHVAQVGGGAPTRSRHDSRQQGYDSTAVDGQNRFRDWCAG